MKILAIDPGQKMGFAYNVRSGSKPTLGRSSTTGMYQLAQDKRWSGAGMPFLRLKRWLVEKHTEHKFDSIYFEEVRKHTGTDAAHFYGGFVGTLMAFCEEYSIPYESVPVGTIKKHATGNGSAGKDKVIASIREKGYFVEDDNEADAIAIWFFAHDLNSLLM